MHAEAVDFQVWKTVYCPRAVCTAEQLIRDIELEQIYVEREVIDLVTRHSPVLENPGDFDLVNVELAQLFVYHPTEYAPILECAQKYGLHQVPLAVALHLRRVYRDQPVGQRLDIAIPAFRGEHRLLRLMSTAAGKLWLGCTRGCDNDMWKPHQHMVFWKPRT